MDADATGRPGGFDTDDELQEHLALLEADAAAEDRRSPDALSGRTFEDVYADFLAVRDEVEHLRARLSVVTEQAGTVIRSRAEWADASAHAQLGDYPWLKLAGAMTGTYVLASLLRKIPLGSAFTAALPLVAAAIQRRTEG
ncbi:hypothetical protein K9B32_21055 [Rhizobium sp. 3T7]|uniref:hypothetical protein n=1 Tax=Rhizobium sp. 3T7 TaxID=2874922 RepID=UPI001CC90329|nr:hypothetical protein [Rhizobium sp. 3T7]MBZ9792573.1 hypothetical protein [Rhizobium sp. 3T7]